MLTGVKHLNSIVLIRVIGLSSVLNSRSVKTAEMKNSRILIRVIGLSSVLNFRLIG